MPSSIETNDDLLKAVGARIKSELNNLKRTPQACAKDIGLQVEAVGRILDGLASPEDTNAFIEAMGRQYSIDTSNLQMIEDDTTDGIVIMRAADAEATARVVTRPDSAGAQAPHYEYRDSASSRFAPFHADWVRIENVASESLAENPQEALNNGHLSHQISFAVGNVNFYYKDSTGTHCVEMGLGDSNAIMPFHPHGFASREANEKAVVITVAFGGEIGRAQKELSALGERSAKFYSDFRKNNPRLRLLNSHLANARMTPDSLDLLLKRSGSTLTASRATDHRSDLTLEEFTALGDVLDLNPGDLMAPKFQPGDDVQVAFRKDFEPYHFPSEEDPHYLVRSLAQHRALPLVRAVDVEVKGTRSNQDAVFSTGLHTFIHNYGEHEVIFTWVTDDNSHEVILGAGDSVYLQPFVEHSFMATKAKKPGSLLIVSMPGAMGMAAQREIGYFESVSRVSNETKPWFG